MERMQYEGVRDSGIGEHLDFGNIIRVGCPRRYSLVMSVGVSMPCPALGMEAGD